MKKKEQKFNSLKEGLKKLYTSEIFKLNDEGNLSELSEILANGIPEIAENQYALGEQRKFTFESYPHLEEHFNQYPEIYNIEYNILDALKNMKEANIPFNILENLTLQGGKVIVQSASSGGRRVKRRRSKTTRKSKMKKLRKTKKRKQSTRVK